MPMWCCLLFPLFYWLSLLSSKSAIMYQWICPCSPFSLLSDSMFWSYAVVLDQFIHENGFFEDDNYASIFTYIQFEERHFFKMLFIPTVYFCLFWWGGKNQLSVYFELCWGLQFYLIYHIVYFYANTVILLL